MRAVRLVDGAPQMLDVSSPAPRDGWVPVRVAGAGICGSDLHMIDMGLPLTATLGHEIAGTTSDGTAVAVEPIVECGRCRACLQGDHHLCRESLWTLIGAGNDGGMAEEVLVPRHRLVPLPPGVPLADASLVEPLAVAVHGLRLAGAAPGATVTVIGAGTIGLCAALAAHDAGHPVSVVARHDHQRAAAERLGAVVAGDVVDEADEVDLVIETAGTAEAFADAVRRVRPAGTILLLSIHWTPTVTPGVGLWAKEATVVPAMTYGRHRGGRDIDDAAALLARRPDTGPTLITHRFPLDAAADAFAVARDRAAGAIKVVLEP